MVTMRRSWHMSVAGINMDIKSQNIIDFLGHLQKARALLAEVKTFYAADFQYLKSFFVMNPGNYTIWGDDNDQEYDGNISLGLQGTGNNDRDYELVVGIQWNDKGWMIDAECWVQNEEDDGQELLSDPIIYKTDNMEECKQQLLSAIDDLKSFKPTVELSVGFGS